MGFEIRRGAPRRTDNYGNNHVVAMCDRSYCPVCHADPEYQDEITGVI